MWTDFKAFLTQSNALALAVGVIIGAAVGGVVSALAADILMPLISTALPSGDWRQAKWVLSTGVDAAGKATENAVLYGHFLGAVIDFLIIALVVYAITRALLRPKPAVVAAALRACPHCLESIPLAATRCRACTAVI
jgi:large conductance mechanosensitive channel